MHRGGGHFGTAKKQPRVATRLFHFDSGANQNFWLQVKPIVRGCEVRIYGSKPQVPGVHSA
jgi:hypothetical protein